MNLKRTGKNGLVFEMDEPEKEIFSETLQLYPLVPATHHHLSKGSETQSEENQRLLEESLAQQRTENRKELDALLNDPVRFKKVGENFRLRLQATELEWLLQIFNDIRVGCWLMLGEPDEDQSPTITPENFRYGLAMEVCGVFQSALLATFGETESPDWQAET
jgi:hypothetical protein